MVLLGALDRSRESDPLFLLKGGVAIELRVGGGARATKDVDLVFFGVPEDLADALDADLAPYSVFSFERQAIEGRGDGLFDRVDVKLLFRGRVRDRGAADDPLSFPALPDRPEASCRLAALRGGCE
jgi:hypothetical protein